MSVNTSYFPVPFSCIKGPKKEIETLHALVLAALDTNHLEDAGRLFEKMCILSEKVHKEIPATSKKTNALSMGVSQIWRFGQSDPIVNGNDLLQDVNDLLQDVEIRLTSIENSHSSCLQSSKATTTISLSPTQAIHYATGFKNLSNNCWANSLLSMIVELPELREIYTIVAKYHAKDAGKLLLSALEAYDAAFATEEPVPDSVSQGVREAFHFLFGGQGIIFSKDKSAQEDAHEALQVLMGEYDRITREKKSTLSPLYTPLQTKRHYTPIAGTEQASINKNGSQLNADHTSVQTNQDYQVLIDLQGKTHLPFQELLSDFFKNSNVGNSDSSSYLLPNGNKQQFQLICESRQFAQVPREFMLVIKRFGADTYGNRFKITDPIMVQQTLILPPHATTKGCAIAYALDAFIVHSGGSKGGHYICYKKIQDKWVEINDGNVRFVLEAELNQILCGQKSGHFTSYLHHYTIVPELEQAATIRTATSAQNLLPQQTLASSPSGKSVIHTIQSFFNIVQNGNHTTLWIEQLPVPVIDTLRHAVWLHDRTPNELDYGTKQIEKNAKRLQEIRLPWLIGKKGMSLLDQMVAILERKEAIAAEKRPEIAEKLQLSYEKEQLEALLELLSDKTLTNYQLVKAFERMEIRSTLRESIYTSICVMNGKEPILQQGINAFEQNPRCAVETLEQVVALLEQECATS
jgi:ubiquitin C-terminal hydrolase